MLICHSHFASSESRGLHITELDNVDARVRVPGGQMFADNLQRHVWLTEVHLRHCRRRKAIIVRRSDLSVGRLLLRVYFVTCTCSHSTFSSDFLIDSSYTELVVFEGGHL